MNDFDGVVSSTPNQPPRPRCAGVACQCHVPAVATYRQLKRLIGTSRDQIDKLGARGDAFPVHCEYEVAWLQPRTLGRIAWDDSGDQRTGVWQDANVTDFIATLCNRTHGERLRLTAPDRVDADVTVGPPDADRDLADRATRRCCRRPPR